MIQSKNLKTFALLVALTFTVVFTLGSMIAKPRKARAAAPHTIKLLNPWAEGINPEGTDPAPVLITGATVNGSAIETSKTFEADSDWLRTLRVQVQNVSKKPIKGVTLKIEFRNTGLDAMPVNYLGVGESTETVRAPKRVTVPTVVIQPGETVEIGFNSWYEKRYDEYAGHVSHMGEGLTLDKLTKNITIFPMQVIFANGEKWQMFVYNDRVGLRNGPTMEKAAYKPNRSFVCYKYKTPDELESTSCINGTGSNCQP